MIADGVQLIIGVMGGIIAGPAKRETPRSKALYHLCLVMHRYNSRLISYLISNLVACDLSWVSIPRQVCNTRPPVDVFLPGVSRHRSGEGAKGHGNGTAAPAQTGKIIWFL